MPVKLADIFVGTASAAVYASWTAEDFRFRVPERLSLWQPGGALKIASGWESVWSWLMRFTWKVVRLVLPKK